MSLKNASTIDHLLLRFTTGLCGRASADRPAGPGPLALVVRALLLPATMKLLGPRNWYLPRWLGWLPQISPSTPPSAGQPPRQPVTVA
ncbi:MAG TPA: hypothetical protein VIY52_24665 [Streptosporangiaceae bacterium]